MKKKEKKSSNHFFYMYKRLFLCIITNRIFIFTFCLAEFLDYFVCTLTIIPDFFNYNKSYERNKITTVKFLIRISPYHYLLDFLTNKTKFIINKTPTYITLFIFIFFWIIYYITLYLIGDFDYENESLFDKIKSMFLINFYSYIFLRLIGIFGINCIISLCLSIIFQDKYTITDIMLLFLLILLAFGDTFGKFTFFTQFSVLLKFKFHESDINKYPFDTFFGEQYDKLFIFIKIIVCIENNYYLLNHNKVNNLLLFLDFLALTGVTSQGIYLIYIFFINKDSLIYISLNDLTLFRILFINQGCVSIIFYFIFYNSKEHILFTSFTIIYFILNLIITISNFENYVTSQAIISKNILGVCWFFQTNNIDHGTFITAWVVNHKINCDRENCEICKELNEKDNEEKFEGLDNSPVRKNRRVTKYKTVLNPIEENKNLIESYNINSIMKAYPPFNFICKLVGIAYKERYSYDTEDNLRLDFIFLTVLFLSQNNQQFRFYRKVFILSRKYKNQERIVSMLRTITELVKKSQKDMIERYEMIKKNEDLKNDINKYIKDFENFLHFEIKTPENYIKISDKFDNIKKHPNLDSIIRKNNDYDYKMIILRFIYETLINTQLKNVNEFDIGFYTDFLNFHYSQDKILLLNFSIERRLFTIIRGSKQVLKFTGKNFDSLFPEFFKVYGINMCMDKLKNSDIRDNKNFIEIICKDLSSNETIGFVSPMKIEYSVYPTINIDELLIDMNFIIDYTDIIIFQIESNSHLEFLFSLSSNLFKYFGVTPEILSILNKAGKNISFSTLFCRTNMSKEENLCLFRCHSYYQIHKELIKVEGLNESCNFKEMKNFQKQNNFLQNEEEEKKIYFTITKKFTCNDSKVQYNVYHIKEKKKKKQIENAITHVKSSAFTEFASINFNVKEKSEDYNDLSNNKENNENGKYKLDINNVSNNIVGPNLSLFSQASMSAVSLNKNQTSGIGGKFGNKIEEKKKRYKQVYYFTIAIFIYGLCLMILTFTCLILVLRENNIFKKLFSLFQSFKKLQRSIETTPLSLFANFCYYSANSEKCINYYENYSKDLQNKFDSLKNIPLINYALQLDLPGRFQIAVQSFQNFENDVYTLDFGGLYKIKILTVLKFKVLIQKPSIIILREELLFVDLIREYINWLTYIMENDYLNEIFSLFNFIYNDDNQQIIITADNSTDLSQSKKNMYLVLLNCPIIHYGLELICDIIQNEFHNALDILNGYLVGFFFALLILHIILYIICYFFLFIFIKMLKTNIYPMNVQFEDLKYANFIEERYANLKDLCSFYLDNPNMIIHTISSDEEFFKKKIKEKNQTKTKETETPEESNYNYKIPKINDKHFINVIYNYRIVITIIFLIYFIYSVLFFIYVNKGKKKLIYLVDYSKINQKLDSFTYDNFNSLVYLMLTNSSRYDIGKKILNLDNYDYLFEKMTELHQIIREKETMEVIHKNIFPPLNTQVDLNCVNGKIDDQHMRKALKKINVDFIDFLIPICENFPVSTIGDDNMFIKNILYLLNQLYNKYYQGEFKDIQNLIQQPDLFNLYTFVLIINRIIRFYFNESVFTKEINNIFYHFSSLIIPYLIFNMILELVIFIILNIFVIAKIKKMHKKLNQFINSLKFI